MSTMVSDDGDTLCVGCWVSLIGEDDDACIGLSEEPCDECGGEGSELSIDDDGGLWETRGVDF